MTSETEYSTDSGGQYTYVLGNHLTWKKEYKDEPKVLKNIIKESYLTRTQGERLDIAEHKIVHLTKEVEDLKNTVDTLQELVNRVTPFSPPHSMPSLLSPAELISHTMLPPHIQPQQHRPLPYSPQQGEHQPQ